MASMSSQHSSGEPTSLSAHDWCGNPVLFQNTVDKELEVSKVVQATLCCWDELQDKAYQMKDFETRIHTHTYIHTSIYMVSVNIYGSSGIKAVSGSWPGCFASICWNAGGGRNLLWHLCRLSNIFGLEYIHCLELRKSYFLNAEQFGIMAIVIVMAITVCQTLKIYFNIYEIYTYIFNIF